MLLTSPLDRSQKGGQEETAAIGIEHKVFSRKKRKRKYDRKYGIINPVQREAFEQLFECDGRFSNVGIVGSTFREGGGAGGLRGRSSVARLLGLRVRISLMIWMSVSVMYCQVGVSATGRSLV
jgi:hypothetical protein